MRTTTEKERNEALRKFMRKHSQSEYRCCTSPLENNVYHKEWCWEDGAEWYERSELITEVHEVEAHGLTFKLEVEMWRTEYWSSDSPSAYYYSR